MESVSTIKNTSEMWCHVSDRYVHVQYFTATCCPCVQCWKVNWKGIGETVAL